MDPRETELDEVDLEAIVGGRQARTGEKHELRIDRVGRFYMRRKFRFQGPPETGS